MNTVLRATLLTFGISFFSMTLASTTATANTTAVTANSTANNSTTSKAQRLNRIVAIANQDAITQTQLNEAVKQATMQITQAGLTPPSAQALQRQVLQQLILQKIALQLAKVNNITVSDVEVDQAIDSLLDNNHATQAQLEQSLQQAGVSLDAYRDTIRTQLIISRLEQKAVASSIMVTPQEIDNFLSARAKLSNNTEYDISHILISLPNNPTPQDIAQYQAKAQNIVNELNQKKITFAKAAMQYSSAGDAMQGGDLGYETANQIPSVFVKYLPGMKVGSIVGPIQDASGFHIFTLNGTKTPPQQQHFVEQYHIQNILIKTTPVVDDARAQTMLNELREAIQNGKSFSTLAEQNSQDSSTRSKGGDMGWNSLTNLTDPTLANEVASLPLNTVSTPFKTNDGWQIIEVIGKRQYNDTKDYLRDQAAQTIFRQKAQNALQTWQDKILGESYVHILIPSLRPTAS